LSLNPVYGEVYSIQHYAITFASDLRQVGGFLRVIMGILLNEILPSVPNIQLKSHNIYFLILESTETFIGSTNEIETSVKRKSTNGGISVSLRQTNVRSTNTNRKRVIKMLFVIVFEYFVCCSPLYILNTWKVIHYMSIHNKVSDAAWSLILLLNYLSSCIHPITYCFMNKNFRSAFLGVFHCFLSKTKPFGRSCTQMTNMNSSSLARRGNTKIDRDSSKDVS
jgi:hypothetical protein